MLFNNTLSAVLLGLCGFATASEALPTVTLPYGSWQANGLDPDGKVCDIDRVWQIKLIDWHYAVLHLQKCPLWSSTDGNCSISGPNHARSRAHTVATGQYLQAKVHSRQIISHDHVHAVSYNDSLPGTDAYQRARRRLPIP